MASENAKAVAREIIAKVRKGEKVNKGEILKNNGYSKYTSIKPKQVEKTKAFQEEMRPVLQAMIEERDAAIAEMKIKRDKAGYNDLTTAADKLTKNIELLSGGDTERVNINSYNWEDYEQKPNNTI